VSALFVVGTGGHARVVIDTAVAQGRAVVAVVDELSATAGADESLMLGVPVFIGKGALSDVLQRWPDAPAVVAIGDCRIRERVSQELAAQNVLLADAIVHPMAWVSPHAIVAPNSVVMAGAIVQTGAHIGSGVIINTRASVDHDCHIGDYAHIAPGATLAGDVRVGARSFVGTGASIIPGIQIGDDVLIGAGATVVNAVASASRVAGVPARPLRPSP
jgi:UDP-perosamine 4-acetyltransferase